jgi:O-antigen/teichoic acid export membrane protein
MGILRDYVCLSFSQIAGLALALISKVIFARVLGPAEYGAFGVALSSILIVAQIVSIGMVPSAQFFASKHSVHRPTLIATASLVSLFVACVVVALSVLVQWAVFPSLSKQPPDISWQVFFALAYSFPIIIISRVAAIILIPAGMVFSYAAISVVSQLAQLLTFLLFSFITAPIAAACLGQALGWGTTLILCLVVLRPELKNWRFSRELVTRLLSYGIRIWPNSLLNVGNTRLAILLAAAFLHDDQLGFFLVASNVAEGIFFLHGGLGQLILSRVSADERRSFGLVQRITRLYVLAIILVALAYCAVGKELLVLMFGQQYQNSWDASLILLIAGSAHAVRSILGNFLAGIGLPTRNTYVLGIEMVSLLSLVPSLGFLGGIDGVALACAISALLGLVTSIFQAKSIMECSVGSLVLAGFGDLRTLTSSISRKCLAWGNRPQP